MAEFPLVVNFEGDYGMKVLMVPEESTMDDVARIAKEQLVGVVVKPLKPGAALVVKRHGAAAALSGSLKVKDAGFVKMETLDILVA
jgi:toluene monooxygenase system protein B